MFYMQIPFFSLDKTFESGQNLLWKKICDGKYIVTHRNKIVQVEQNRDRFMFSCSQDDFYNIWFEYFDLGTDYMDLYLLHQPYGKVDEAWNALEEAKDEGKIKSIGVSNMTPTLWNKWVPDFDSIPSVNQVEFNPYIQQNELREILNPLDVKIQAWGPLGHGDADLLSNPVILKIAEKYGKNAGQVILRFENQEEIIVFPKSFL